MPSRSDLAKIHIAKKALGLDDASYRGILWDRYHLDTAADLSPVQAADLITLFRAKGWRPASAGQRGLIFALWHQLGAAGVVRHDDDAALAQFVAHATGGRQLQQLTVREASHLIEMLKQWLKREGIEDRRH